MTQTAQPNTPEIIHNETPVKPKNNIRFIDTESVFWNYVDNFLTRYNKPFIFTQANSFLKAEYEVSGKKFGILYRKQLSDEDMKILWVFAAIKRSVKKWLAQNRLHIISGNYYPVKKGVAWSKVQVGGKFKGTDLNHCYLRIAFNLGYISERLYKKLTDKKYKLVRNKALACLRGRTKSVRFTGAEMQGKPWYDGSGEMEQLYNDIRNRAYKMMTEAMYACGKGFIKYNTDCVYYLPKHQKKVEAILEKHNMLFTTFNCEKVDANYFIEIKGEKSKDKKY